MTYSCSKNQKGQGLVEYSLILVLVAIVVIAVLMVLGPQIGHVFSSINNSVSGITSSTGTTTTSTDTYSELWSCDNQTTFFTATCPIGQSPHCNSTSSWVCQ
jgi:pilus assembly protein Flp/PilA